MNENNILIDHKEVPVIKDKLWNILENIPKIFNKKMQTKSTEYKVGFFDCFEFVRGCYMKETSYNLQMQITKRK
jgi:hypothetical protein